MASAATWSPSHLPGLTWALAACGTCSSSRGTRGSRAGLGMADMSAVLWRQSQGSSRWGSSGVGKHQPRLGSQLSIGALLPHETPCPHLSLTGGTEPQASDLWWWSQGSWPPPLGAMVCHIHVEWPQDPQEAPWALPGAGTDCLHRGAQRLSLGRPPLAAFESTTLHNNKTVIAGC